MRNPGVDVEIDSIPDAVALELTEEEQASLNRIGEKAMSLKSAFNMAMEAAGNAERCLWDFV